VLQTFFDGSLERALGAYLHGPGAKPDTAELKRLTAIIQDAKKSKGKQTNGREVAH
jgi:hypothetical protein